MSLRGFAFRAPVGIIMMVLGDQGGEEGGDEEGCAIPLFDS